LSHTWTLKWVYKELGSTTHKDLYAYESIDSNSAKIGGLHRDLQAHKCIEFDGWEIGKVR